MRAILQLKHWQFFVFFFVLPALAFIGIYAWFIFTMIDMTSNMPMNGGGSGDIDEILAFQQYMMKRMAFLYIPMIVPFVASHIWMWSIAKQCKEWVDESLHMGNVMFKITLLFPVVYMLVYGIGMFFYLQNFMTNMDSFNPNDGMAGFFAIWAFSLLGGLLSFASSLHNYYFTARSYKTAELQRKTTFGEYVGEFFMSWFLFVGIWIMQPKLNRWLVNGPDQDDDFIDLITD